VLGREAEPGVATIVARKNVGMRTTGGISATYEYIADVQPDSGGPAFRATFKEHFSGQFRNAGIHRPDVGEQARVTFDPRSHKVEFDTAALRAAGKASKHESDASFDALATGAPGTTPSASDRSKDPDDSFEQARQIWRENLKQGYCTQEEFDKEMRDLDGA
jgi:hypothetical protein